MNENDINNGFNPQPTAPTFPEAPAAPSEPVAPVEPAPAATPSFPSEPVAPEAPVMPSAPETPVVPVQPSVTPVAPAPGVAPVAPNPSMGMPTVQPVAPQAPKKNSSVFAVVVIVLVLAIGGLGAYLLFGNGDKKMDDNTSTSSQTSVRGVEVTNETTTAEVQTSTRAVTTQPNTTTVQRTTRPSDDPTPTVNGSSSVKVGNYTLNFSSKYKNVELNEGPMVVNQTDGIQLLFEPYNVPMNTFIANIDDFERAIQAQGFTIEDALEGTYNGVYMIALELDSDIVPENCVYFAFITELDSNSTLVSYALLKDVSDVAEKVLNDLTNALNTKVQSFANEKVNYASQPNTKLFDKLDERLFN